MAALNSWPRLVKYRLFSHGIFQKYRSRMFLIWSLSSLKEAKSFGTWLLCGHGKEGLCGFVCETKLEESTLQSKMSKNGRKDVNAISGEL